MSGSLASSENLVAGAPCDTTGVETGLPESIATDAARFQAAASRVVKESTLQDIKKQQGVFQWHVGPRAWDSQMHNCEELGKKTSLAEMPDETGKPLKHMECRLGRPFDRGEEAFQLK